MSLTIASFGHCWSMFTAQVLQMAAVEHHAGHGHQHDHPNQVPAHEQGDEMSVAGVATAMGVAVSPPAAKLLPVQAPNALAVLFDPAAVTRLQQRDHIARAGPSAFAVVYARTGRLII